MKWPICPPVSLESTLFRWTNCPPGFQCPQDDRWQAGLQSRGWRVGGEGQEAARMQEDRGVREMGEEGNGERELLGCREDWQGILTHSHTWSSSTHRYIHNQSPSALSTFVHMYTHHPVCHQTVKQGHESGNGRPGVGRGHPWVSGAQEQTGKTPTATQAIVGGVCAHAPLAAATAVSSKKSISWLVQGSMCLLHSGLSLTPSPTSPSLPLLPLLGIQRHIWGQGVHVCMCVLLLES